MRSALLALPVLFAFASIGCAAPTSEDAAASSNDLSSSTSTTAPAADRECVIDTIVVKPGLVKDFQAALGPQFTHVYGGSFYDHVEIPGVFDAAVAPNAEFGEWFYTIIGLNHEPEKLADGSDGPRMTVSLEAGPSDDATLTTAAQHYNAAKAIFDGMTRAKETTKEHHAAPHSFDQSWKIVRRESAAGRVVCEARTNPDTTETRPDITCTFFDVERTNVQIFSTKDTSGRCLAQ